MERRLTTGIAGLLALGLAASCGAQGWASAYDFSRDELAPSTPGWTDACPWSGGILLSASDSPGGGSVVLRLASDGTVVEATRVSAVRIAGLRTLPDDSAIFVGVIQSLRRRGVVGRLLPGGALSWAIDVGPPDTDAGIAVDLTPSGNIVVAHEMGSPDPRAIRLTELDASGGIVGAWDVPGLAGAVPGRRPALAALADGGVAVGGVTSRECGVVVRFDASRAVAWQRRAARGCDLAAVSAQPDSSIDLACDSMAGVTTLARLSPAGATTWQLALPGASTTRRLASAPNGDVLVAQSQGWLARVAADGSGITWERQAAGTQGVVGRLPSGETMMAVDPGLVVRFDATGALSGPCSRVQPLGVAASAGALAWDVPALAVSAVAASVTPLSLTLRPIAFEVHPTCTTWGCEVDAFEPDDACGATATELVAGVPQLHDACDDTDDWLLVQACAGVPLVVTTSGLGPSADTVIELWSLDCSQLLVADDNGGGGLASRVVHVPSQDGPLFVRVAQADASFGPGREWTVLREADACVPPTWHIYGANPGSTDRAALAETTSGVAVARGEAWWSGPAEYAVTRLDLAGSVERITLFPAPQPMTDMGVLCVAADGDALRVGGLTSNLDTPWVASITASDQLEWLSLLDLGMRLVTTHVASNADGSTTLLLMNDWDDIEPPAFVVRLGASGDVAWALVLPPDVLAHSLAALPDGGVLVGSTDATPSVRITRLDAAGVEAWTTVLDVDLEPESIAVGPTGRIFVAIEDFRLSAFVALEPDGSLAWARRLTRDSEFCLLRPRPDGLIGFALNDDGALGAFDTEGSLSFLRGREDGIDFEYWEPLSLRAGYVGVGSDQARLDALGGSPDCEDAPLVRAFLEPLPLTASAGSSGLAPAAATAIVVVGTPSNTTLPWRVECGSIDCPMLVVEIAGSRDSCLGGGFQPYGAVLTGVVGHVQACEWDFDYDGVAFDVDASGQAAQWTPAAAADYRVAVRVTDACAPPRTVTAEILVHVRSPAGAGVIGPGRRCSDDPCTLLEAPPGTSQLSWMPGGESSSSICVDPDVTTTYGLIGLDAAGCPFVAEHELAVDAAPQVALLVECEPPNALIRSIVSDCPGCTYAWDSGETTPDVLAPPGVTRTLTVTTSDGCFATSSADTGAPCFVGEVSGPGRIPLRVRKAGADVELRFERRAEATAYNVLGNGFGTWIAAGGFACRATPWVDQGDGSITLEISIPASSWLVVTASNPDGEGSAGRDSRLTERATRAGWIGCGPAP